MNPFRGYRGPQLSKADVDQGVAAARKLLGTDEAKVGAAETWAEPTSGNSGSWTVQKAFERDGTTCRSLLSVVSYKSGRKRTWTLDVCRQASGEWKIV